MFKRYKGQFLTIPNILGYIRIFLMLILLSYTLMQEITILQQ